MNFPTRSLLPVHPGWEFSGKTYKTVTGLLNAIARDCNAASVGMAALNGTITARALGSSVVAVYDVTPPVPGQRQRILRIPAKLQNIPERIEHDTHTEAELDELHAWRILSRGC